MGFVKGACYCFTNRTNLTFSYIQDVLSSFCSLSSRIHIHIYIYIYIHIYILYIVYIFLAAKWPSKNTILLQRGHPNYPQLHPPHLEAKPVPKPVDSDAFATLDLGFGMAEVVAIQRIQGRWGAEMHWAIRLLVVRNVRVTFNKTLKMKLAVIKTLATFYYVTFHYTGWLIGIPIMAITNLV